MSGRLIHKLENFVRLSADERAELERIAAKDVRALDAHVDIIAEGDRPTVINLILEGFACRYRLLQDGRTVFYEFLTIVEEHHSLSLRLKHFGPDLRGWEEREESVRMPLVAMRAGRICFDGLTFEPNHDGTVTIYLAIRSKDGATREEVFRYRRQVSNGP